MFLNGGMDGNIIVTIQYMSKLISYKWHLIKMTLKQKTKQKTKKKKQRKKGMKLLIFKTQIIILKRPTILPQTYDTCRNTIITLNAIGDAL